MKIIFFGTSEFAIPSLKRLLEAGYDIVAVITQPDKPAGRKQLPLPSPVKLWALEHKLKVYQPASLEIENWKLKIPDIGIVASYGKIIPKELLSWPKHGLLNVHPSLLPKYRGPSPIQAAILNGDIETGVTIIKLDEEMDHGAIVSSFKFQVSNNFGYQELHDKLAELGADLLIKILPDYFSGKIKPVPQEHSQATYTKIIKKNDARIDWNLPAEKIEAMVRAYENWPVAWTTLDGKRLKIFKALLPVSPPPAGKGEIKRGLISISSGNKILVQTGSGILQIHELQLEGGKKMSAQDFIRGRKNLVGKIMV